MQNRCIANGSGEIDREEEERIVPAGVRSLVVLNRHARKNALFTMIGAQERIRNHFNFTPSTILPSLSSFNTGFGETYWCEKKYSIVNWINTGEDFFPAPAYTLGMHR